MQQCIRDKGVLEVLCNYVSACFHVYWLFRTVRFMSVELSSICLPQASPSKKFQPSRPVVSFCTAVVVEVLGSVTPLDDGLVKKILPFVSSGLQPGAKSGSDHKV